MKKMPCLFSREFIDKGKFILLPQINPECEWVNTSEWKMFRKWDGTACLVRDRKVYKRYDAKRGKVPPANFEPCGEPDPITGHNPGWVPVGDGPEDIWHRKGVFVVPNDCGVHYVPPGGELLVPLMVPDGTYELCGPAINSNKENLIPFRDGETLMEYFYISHQLLSLPCGPAGYLSLPLDFEEVKAFLARQPVEGVVLWEQDSRGNFTGRMAKIRRADFGFDWPIKGNHVQPLP